MKIQQISLGSIKDKLSRDEMKSIGGGVANPSSRCFVCESTWGAHECIEYAEGNIRYYCKERYGSAIFHYIECAPGECEL